MNWFLIWHKTFCLIIDWQMFYFADTVPESYQVSGLSATSLPGHSQSTSVFTLSSSLTSPSSNISSSSSVPPPIYSSIDHGPHLEGKNEITRILAADIKVL